MDVKGFVKKEEGTIEEEFYRIDNKIIAWTSRHGLNYLRYSVAVVFIWFGVLKPLGMSPAAELVAGTVYWLPADVFFPILGWWEVLIGVCLLFRPLLRIGLGLMALQMAGTFLPLIILPEVAFNGSIFYLTMEGQYIIKNLVIIAAALVIGSHVKDKKA